MSKGTISSVNMEGFNAYIACDISTFNRDEKKLAEFAICTPDLHVAAWNSGCYNNGLFECPRDGTYQINVVARIKCFSSHTRNPHSPIKRSLEYTEDNIVLQVTDDSERSYLDYYYGSSQVTTRLKEGTKLKLVLQPRFVLCPGSQFSIVRLGD